MGSPVLFSAPRGDARNAPGAARAKRAWRGARETRLALESGHPGQPVAMRRLVVII
jgi:hypothetical protein